MGLEDLSIPHIPGDKVRLKLLQRGAEWQRERFMDRVTAVLEKRKAAGPRYSQTFSYDELVKLLEE